MKLNAPHQTGKTSYLMALLNYFNKKGKYKALYTNIENPQAARENVQEGMWAMMKQAKEKLILRRETHLDRLADKLIEVRVKQVITPLLTSLNNIETIKSDDIDYVVDFGLIKRKDKCGTQEGYLLIFNSSRAVT